MASGWTMRAVVARLLACELRSRRGRANGYAALDATGRIPGGQLPGSTVLALWRNTTDGTPTELFFDGASSRFTLADNAAYRIQVRILACRSDVGAAANTAIWRFEGVAYRGSGAGSVSWDQSFGDPVTHATGWSAAVSADTVNGSLKFAVTGAAAQAVSWYAVVDYLALPSNQAFTGPGSAVALGPPVLPLLAVTLQNTAARTGRTPPAGELIRDTTSGALYVGDGAMAGGVAPAVLDRGGQAFHVDAYGAKGDGATDDTSAVVAALAAASAAGGGEVRFGPKTYRINSQLTLPNDAGGTPRQAPLRIVGAGSFWSGRGTATYGSTVLDLRATTSPAKILTLGLGYLEISGVTFTDNGGSSNPFLLTTNTTLHIHDCSFVGTKTTTACDQDCLILGGATTSIGGATTNAFQGYGTVIRNNYFGHIRRAVLGQVFANGIVIRDNTVWATSGSNLAGGAAFEFDGDTTQVDSGNVISGNLIEVTGYPYGIKLTDSLHNSLIANNFYDGSTPTLAYIRLEATATLNVIIAGFGSDAFPTLSDAATGSNANTLITSHQSQQSIFGQPVTFAAAAGTTFAGPGIFTGAGGAVTLQPAAAQSDSTVMLLAKRSAAEGTNAGSSIWSLQQNGTVTIDPTASAGGNMTGPFAKFTGGGRTWSGVGTAAGQTTGGNMVWDSGTGGSHNDIKGFDVRVFAQDGTTRILTLGNAVSGVDLAAGKVYKVNTVQVVGAQGAAVADATDAASAIAQLNALLARVRAHGLIAP